MNIDYVRVYQDPTKINIGCDPEDMPTASYIARYPDAYHNPNIVRYAERGLGGPSLTILSPPCVDHMGPIDKQRTQAKEQLDRHVLITGC